MGIYVGKNIIASMEKNFDGWNTKKKWLHSSERNVYPKPREVWWCALGINIGNEVDGKNENFERPIVIAKTYGTKTVWGLPTTTQEKNGEFYFRYTLGGETFNVSLTDMRSLSYKRLLRKVGRMDKDSFGRLQERLKIFL